MFIWRDTDGQFNTTPGQMTLKILSNAQKNLAAGITTVRDLGGWNELEFDVWKSIQNGDFVGPRMCLAGRFISITEAGADCYVGMYREADGVDDVRKAVREQVKHGAGWESPVRYLLKLVLQARLISTTTRYRHWWTKQRNSAMHAHGIDGIRKAVRAGVSTLEHGTYLYQDPTVIECLVKQNIFLVPTLKLFHMLDDAHRIPDWITNKSRVAHVDAVRSLKMAYDAGVQIAMGSDAGTPLNMHGENALEVYLMQQAGVSTHRLLTDDCNKIALKFQCGRINSPKRNK
jgi:imidazolonepropionase-like amidohydrolase